MRGCKKRFILFRGHLAAERPRPLPRTRLHLRSPKLEARANACECGTQFFADGEGMMTAGEEEDGPGSVEDAEDVGDV